MCLKVEKFNLSLKVADNTTVIFDYCFAQFLHEGFISQATHTHKTG